MATIQLEFFTLSHYTGNPIYAEKVLFLFFFFKQIDRLLTWLSSFAKAQAITDFLDSYKRSEYKYGTILPGLFPNEINVKTGKFRLCM